MKGSNEEENKTCASLVVKNLKSKVMGGHGVSFFREDPIFKYFEKQLLQW
jgi:hypothetical protein